MQFTGNETLLKSKGNLRVKLYWFLMYMGIGATQGNGAQKAQIKGTDTQKVTLNVKLHISHQLKPCSSVKAI